MRALGSKTYPHKPQVFPGAHEPRMAAGLSEPQTADLTDDQLADLTAHWFWIGAKHSPDTGGYLPSSSVQWCLGGPRGDDNWPRSRTRNLSGRCPAPSTQRTCRTPTRTPSVGDLGRPGGKLCSGFHSQEEKLGKTNFSKLKKNGTIKWRKGALLSILFRSRFLSQDVFVEIVARRRSRQKESLMNFNTKSIKQTSN